MMDALAQPTEGSTTPPRSQSFTTSREPQGIKHVLVCLDRSRFSEVSVPHAVLLAKTFGCSMTLLHVMQAQKDPGGSMATNALGWEISRREAHNYLHTVGMGAATISATPVDTRLEQGHPAERITAVAREVNADLIVLGSHGEGGVAAWNLGSTAQQVLSTTRGSVYVARSTSALSSATSVEPKRILVPLDGSLRTESVIPAVLRLATQHHSEVLLVHVVAEPHPVAMLEAAGLLEQARQIAAHVEVRAKEYLGQLSEQFIRDGIPVRTLVIRQSDERQTLIDTARNENVDLIVLSAHGSTCNPICTFGSVASHLIAHSTVPVLVMQDLTSREHARESVDSERAPALRASFPPEGA